MAKAMIAFALAALLAGCGDPAPIGALPAGPSVATAEGGQRLDLRFACGDSQCAGWLYLPAGAERAPVVVMAHGFAGTRDVGLPFFAERFARRGIAAFVFDYRHFGASGGAPRQLVNPWTQLDDWKAAIAFVRSRQGVDGGRLALWGTSLGGGLALVAATRDGNVAAVVAQAPLVDTTVEGEATFPGYWWMARLLFTGWFDLAWSALDDEPTMIAAIAPSDGFGMMPDDAAFKAVGSLVPKGSLYRNEVAARSIFTFDDYNPAVLAAELKVPTLLIASQGDRLAPFAAAKDFVSAHGNAMLREIEGDHFDIYAPPQSEAAADWAGAFLVEHLKPVGQVTKSD